MRTRIPYRVQFLVDVEDRDVLSIYRIECSTVVRYLGRVADRYRHRMVLYGHIGGADSIGVFLVVGLVALSAEKDC